MNPVLLLAIGVLGVAGGIAAYWSFRPSDDDDLVEAPPPTPNEAPVPVERPAVVDPKLRLSAHFTLDEFTKSATATAKNIDNTPTPTALRALRGLVVQVLEPLRVDLRTAINITSGYRSPKLNDAIDGADDSQHTRGEAADFKASSRTSAEVMVRLWNAAREGMPLDQVILYHPSRGGHLHVSYTTRRAPRGEFLYAPEGGGYRSWSPS